MIDLIEQHITELKKIDESRVLWLRLSVFVGIALFIFFVNLIFFNNSTIHWVVAISGFMLAVAWWYWTMKMIQQLLTHRETETKILLELLCDIHDVKEGLKKII